VPEAQVAAVVEEKIREMDLSQYANKLAGTLSGGACIRDDAVTVEESCAACRRRARSV
jgi:hypothetical protein